MNFQKRKNVYYFSNLIKRYDKREYDYHFLFSSCKWGMSHKTFILELLTAMIKKPADEKLETLCCWKLRGFWFGSVDELFVIKTTSQKFHIEIISHFNHFLLGIKTLKRYIFDMVKTTLIFLEIYTVLLQKICENYFPIFL